MKVEKRKWSLPLVTLEYSGNRDQRAEMECVKKNPLCYNEAWYTKGTVKLTFGKGKAGKVTSDCRERLEAR